MKVRVVDPVEVLRGRVKWHGDQSALAKEIGVSRQYLSDLLAGRRAPAKKVLYYLGLERAIIERSR